QRRNQNGKSGFRKLHGKTRIKNNSTLAIRFYVRFAGVIILSCAFFTCVCDIFVLTLQKTF
ncbi:MAG: hypothetical protein IIU03_10830, partial [Bacteroidales bacterium]|nr:hypothetical protein [Bacteroidales bacterium]